MSEMKVIAGFGNAIDAQSISKARSLKNQADPSKIEKAAKEFESLLLGHWLEQAQKSFATVPGADEENGDNDGPTDPGSSQFQGLGMQTLAKQITNSGGIGIARLICRHLHADNAASENPGPDRQVSEKNRLAP